MSDRIGFDYLTPFSVVKQKKFDPAAQVTSTCLQGKKRYRNDWGPMVARVSPNKGPTMGSQVDNRLVDMRRDILYMGNIAKKLCHPLKVV